MRYCVRPRTDLPALDYARYDRGMSNERKKAVWPWIAALLLGLPVLYVGSFGPACWIVARHQALRPVFREAFLPLGRIAKGWKPALDGLCWFGSIGMPEIGSLSWEIDRDSTGDTAVILVR